MSASNTSFDAATQVNSNVSTMDNRVSSEAHVKAESFLAALDIGQWTRDGAWNCAWAFRGQRDAEWRLSPSAWRSPSSPLLQRLSSLRDEFSHQFGDRIRDIVAKNQRIRGADAEFLLKAYAQGRAEFSLLRDFLDLADELGHRVPDIQVYRRLATSDYLADVQNYPNMRFLPETNAAVALAQHHGVPTRALDWTRNPLYAAYFAASEVTDPNAESRLAVWAIRTDLLSELGRSQRSGETYARFIARTIPTADNPYLTSQEALLVEPIHGCAHIAATGEFPDLETFAAGLQLHSPNPMIRKLTLPHAEAGELLRVLWLRGVSRAHLMPTMDNVVHALTGRWRWSAITSPGGRV